MKYYTVILYAPDTVADGAERVTPILVPACNKKGNMRSCDDAIYLARHKACKQLTSHTMDHVDIDDWIPTHVFYRGQTVWMPQ